MGKKQVAKPVAPKARTVARGTVAALVKTFIASVVPSFKGYIASRQEATAQRVSMSAVCLSALLAMRDGATFEQFNDALVIVFGNGVKGKLHTAGTLRDQFPDEGERRIVGQYCMWSRRIAEYLSLQSNYDKAVKEKLTFDALVKLTAPKGKLVAGKRDTSAQQPSDAVSETAEQAIARFGAGPMLTALSAVLSTSKATKLAAATLASIAVQIAA
jgi:hypothetical protein